MEPPLLRPRLMKKYLDLLKETFKEFGEDKAPRLGAALAYYTVFSIAPLMMIAIAIAGFALGEEAAKGELSKQLGNLMGAKTAESLNEMVQNVSAEKKGGMLAGILSVITLMFGASGLFAQLNDALDTIWNVEKKKAGGIMVAIKERFLSMAMVCGVGFLLLVTLIVDTAVSATGNYIGKQFPGGEAVMHALQLTLSFVVVTVLFAAIFRFLPDIKISWRDVWLGAILTSVLFVIGKFALGLYIGKTAADSTYGAAGSLVVLLIWVYWSAQILFLGAEFTQVYARTYGSLKGDTSKRDARAQGQRVEDRPKVQTTASGAPVPVYAKSRTPQPQQKQKGGGGFLKLVIGGLAGLFFGAIIGGVSAFGLVLKSIRKLIPIR